MRGIGRPRSLRGEMYLQVSENYKCGEQNAEILGDLTIEVSQSLLLSMYGYHVSYARFAVFKCDLYQSCRYGKVVLIVGLASYDKGESDAWDIIED